MSSWSIKQTFGCLSGLLATLVTLPIWFFLLYQILDRIGASNAMWMAYWVYLPANLIVSILGNLLGHLDDD